MKNKNICKFISSAVDDRLVFSCFILESDRDVMQQTRRLDDNRAILVKQGKGSFIFDGKAYPFEGGMLVFGFKGENFSAEPTDECEYMYIDFDGVRAGELFRRFLIGEYNRCFSGFESLIPFWNDSLARADSETVDLASESTLLYTFSRMSGENTEHNDLVSKIIEMSEQNFADPDLSLASISEQLSYNPKYISHIFKQKTGRGYSEYLRTLRMKYAVTLFDYGIDSVKNVALLSGFTDPLYFSSVFKKHIGVSPKDYISRKKAP